MEPDNAYDNLDEDSAISIHGLRMEPDILSCEFCKRDIISIHGLRMEPDKRTT